MVFVDSMDEAYEKQHLERVIVYLWWALRYLDVDGVIVTVKIAMYEDTTEKWMEERFLVLE